MDGRAGGRGEVHAGMLLPLAQDGMQAHREARGDPGEGQRRLQEGLLQRLAVKGVVAASAGLAGRVAEPDGLVAVAGVVEFAGQHAAGAHQVAVLPEGFIDHIEAVAAAQVGGEVDVGGEHVHQLHGHGVRDLHRIGGGEEGGEDHAGAHFHAALQHGRLCFGAQLAVVARDDQVLGRVAAVIQGGRELDQLAIVIGLGHDALAGAQLHHRTRQGIGLDEGHGLIVIHAQAVEQGGQGVAAAHLLFVDVVLRLLFQGADLMLQIRQGQFLGDRVDRGVLHVRFGRGEAGCADGEGRQEQGAGTDDASLGRGGGDFVVAGLQHGEAQGRGVLEFILWEHANRIR
ncbi:conserved hypothetical protein [Ricinus communis]|uniref:Uncharacterized protein n=1 Tax=Ricinus communis TaxID=3988 RepID=B9TGS5_RICCO|nr:conserved hypothetical protein [Ricinus communis]